MKKYKRHFSMVEILLALGVCVIGIVSIMVFFPVGLSASRDSAMETYAANAADQTLNYLKYAICDKQENWDNYISGSAPQIPKYDKDDGFNVEDEDTPYNLKDTSTWEKNTIFSGITNNLFEHQGDKGTYLLLSSRENNPPLDSDKIDFRAVMNIRQQQIEIVNEIPLEMAVQLLVEVSWPAELPYERRQKSLFVLEVFNPNYTP